MMHNSQTLIIDSTLPAGDVVPRVGAGHVPEAAVLEGGVVEREPEADELQGVVVQEGAVLVGSH